MHLQHSGPVSSSCSWQRQPRCLGHPAAEGTCEPWRRQIAEQYESVWTKDRTHNLVVRLRHNVIRAGLYRISLAYWRISLADVAAKLGECWICRQVVTALPCASVMVRPFTLVVRPSSVWHWSVECGMWSSPGVLWVLTALLPVLSSTH